MLNALQSANGILRRGATGLLPAGGGIPHSVARGFPGMGYPYLWARGIARERLGLLEALWASFAGVANDRVLVARPLASPIFSATFGGFFRRPLNPAFYFSCLLA